MNCESVLGITFFSGMADNLAVDVEERWVVKDWLVISGLFLSILVADKQRRLGIYLPLFQVLDRTVVLLLL